MFGFTGLHELIILMLLIGVLSATGLWPRIIRGLRELRGDIPPESTTSRGEDVEIFYRMLGLSPSARWEEIEKAYRAKAKIHHPDHGGDEDTMRALNEAYARLKRLRGPKRP
ncbi:MAG TPA: J domain-containing protein [Candidatus Hydrogenedentes bacterium]|nr:J domain-containing protein [Candidatus Hydrogenedentota bacterium]HPG69526.1 J domain-containing protein [Candidatus Hydrogenedentota bacterium]